MPAKNLFEIYGEDAPSSPLDALYNPSTPKMEEKENSSAKITLLPADMLKPYREHLFKPYSDDKLYELAEDIKENGVLSPVYVRSYADAYEILAGHNRTEAAKLAGLTEVPCIIKDCDDDTAALIVVNSNLNQRENLLPSEKAKAYKIQMECFNRRGKNVENLGRFSDDDNENQELCQLGKVNFTRRSAYRFIRLTYLTDELLQTVDTGTLALVAGEELSYIDHDEQECIYQYFFFDKKGVLDIKTAKLLRQHSQTVKLTYTEIEKLFQKPPKPQPLKFTRYLQKNIQQFIPPGTSQKDAETKIIKALKYCAENHINI